MEINGKYDKNAKLSFISDDMFILRWKESIEYLQGFCYISKNVFYGENIDYSLNFRHDEKNGGKDGA